MSTPPPQPTSPAVAPIDALGGSPQPIVSPVVDAAPIGTPTGDAAPVDAPTGSTLTPSASAVVEPANNTAPSSASPTGSSPDVEPVKDVVKPPAVPVQTAHTALPTAADKPSWAIRKTPAPATTSTPAESTIALAAASPQFRFNQERIDLMIGFIPQYHTHQEEKTLDSFWPDVMTAYFDRFPEDNKATVSYPRQKTSTGKTSQRRPEGVEKPMRSRIKEWFNNSRRRSDLVASTAAPGASKNVKVNPFKQAGRKQPLWNYFGELYFDTMVQPTMGLYHTYLANLKPGDPVVHHLTWHNSKIQTALKEAPKHIKTEVARYKYLSERRVEDLSDADIIELLKLKKSANKNFEKVAVEEEEGGESSAGGAGSSGGDAVAGASAAGPSGNNAATVARASTEVPSNAPVDGDKGGVGGGVGGGVEGGVEGSESTSLEPGSSATPADTESAAALEMRDMLIERNRIRRERAIQGLPNAIVKMIRGVVGNTDWCISVFAGGMHDNRIQIINLHGGPDDTNTYNHFDPNFVNGTFMRSFTKYLNVIYEKEMRDVLEDEQKAPVINGNSIMPAPAPAPVPAPSTSSRTKDKAAAKAAKAAKSAPAASNSTRKRKHRSSSRSTNGDTIEISDEERPRARARKDKGKGKAKATDDDFMDVDRDEDGWGPSDMDLDEPAADKDDEPLARKDDGAETPSDYSDSDPERPSWDLDPKRRHPDTGERLSLKEYKRVQKSRAFPGKWTGKRVRRHISQAERLAAAERNELRLANLAKESSASEDSGTQQALSGRPKPRPRPRKSTHSEDAMDVEMETIPMREGSPDMEAIYAASRAARKASSATPTSSTPVARTTPSFRAPNKTKSAVTAPTTGEGSSATAAGGVAAGSSTAAMNDAGSRAAQVAKALETANTLRTGIPKIGDIPAELSGSASPKSAPIPPPVEQPVVIPPLVEEPAPIPPPADEPAHVPPPADQPAPPAEPPIEQPAVIPPPAEQPAPIPPPASQPAHVPPPAEQPAPPTEPLIEQPAVIPPPVEWPEADNLADEDDAEVVGPNFDGMTVAQVVAHLGTLEVGDRVAERDFVQEALRELQSASQEEAWLLLLKRYAALEVALAFPTSKSKLPTTSRPSAVAYWVKRHRLWTLQPPIPDLVDYGEDMRRWVAAIMPKWRRTPYGWPLTRIEPPEGGDWTPAHKGGANGFFIAIVASSWWLKSAAPQWARNEALSVIEDLAYAAREVARTAV